jgi:DNA-binding NarL/FixJ family response regulator
MTHGTPDRVVTPKGQAPGVVCRPFIGGVLFDDEMLVLAHIAAGYTDEEIAEISETTIGHVRWVVRNTISKLGARNRPHAVARAIALDYLQVRSHPSA